MKLSIIIPVYNVSKYIDNCISSVIDAASGYEHDVEAIIIDDGSTDESGLKADSWAKECSLIKVIHQKNRGVAVARNIGLEKSCGDFVWFVDSDDMLQGESIRSVLSIIDKDISDIYLFDAIRFDGKKENAWEHFKTDVAFEGRKALSMLSAGALYYPILHYADPKITTLVPLAAPWDKVYRREFLANNHLRFHKNLKVLDDMAFNMEAFSLARKVTYKKIKIYRYNNLASSASITNKYSPNRIEQDREVWRVISEFSRSLELDASDVNIYEQACYLRIIKSFSICCRLMFFNKKNSQGMIKKLKNVRATLELPEYEEAFTNADYQLAEWRLKPMVFLGKHRCALGIWILHLCNNALTKLGH